MASKPWRNPTPTTALCFHAFFLIPKILRRIPRSALGLLTTTICIPICLLRSAFEMGDSHQNHGYGQHRYHQFGRTNARNQQTDAERNGDNASTAASASPTAHTYHRRFHNLIPLYASIAIWCIKLYALRRTAKTGKVSAREVLAHYFRLPRRGKKMAHSAFRIAKMPGGKIGRASLESAPRPFPCGLPGKPSVPSQDLRQSRRLE